MVNDKYGRVGNSGAVPMLREGLNEPGAVWDICAWKSEGSDLRDQCGC